MFSARGSRTRAASDRDLRSWTLAWRMSGNGVRGVVEGEGCYQNEERIAPVFQLAEWSGVDEVVHSVWAAARVLKGKLWRAACCG